MKLRMNYRKSVYGALVGLALVCALGLSYTVSRAKNVFADASSCEGDAYLSGTSVSGIPAIQRACQNCRGDSTQRRGALWISNVAGGGPGRALVLAERVIGGRDTMAHFDFHGMVYNCGHDYDSTNTNVSAEDVWLQAKSGQRIANISYQSHSVWRGVDIPTKYQWTSGGSLSGNYILNLEEFFSEESTCTPLSSGARECTREVDIYRCFQQAGSGCGVDPSIVKAVINDTTSNDDKNHFYSTSTVEIPKQGSDIDEHSATSRPDDTVRLEISTDDKVVKVNFHHNLHYELTAPFGSGDSVPSPSVGWNTREKSGMEEGQSWANAEWRGKTSNSDWVVSDGKTETTSANLDDESVTVVFQDSDSGKTKKVCRRIEYSNKFIDFVVTGATDFGYVWGIEGGNGSGRSDACAYITYVAPNTPSNPPTNPPGDALVTNAAVSLGASAGATDVMLAGEDAALNIGGTAKSILTRRLIGKESVLYNFAAGTSYASVGNIMVGNPRLRNTSLCSVFSSALACKTVRDDRITADYVEQVEANLDRVIEPNPNQSGYGAAIAVPDDVGQKYCAAFGYKYRYYWGIKYGANTTEWRGEPHKDYTFLASPACRTIAKKPTTAFWNGSILMANGSIVMSLARRHVLADGNGPGFGYITDGGNLRDVETDTTVADNRNLYGSWSEYMAISADVMTKAQAIASGSSLSRGRRTDAPNDYICNAISSPWSTASPLTVANVRCELGGAGSGLNSSSFRTRLAAYLQTLADNPMPGVEVRNYGNDDVKIEQNIINEGTYTLRTLPQTIIFANNVYISGNVDRIDAWIIATGTVNTCAEFSEGAGVAGNVQNIGTSSDGVGRTGDACTKQLVFNGPVIAKNLELKRSFGADPQAKMTQGWNLSGWTEYSVRESSAEIFNLRADAYLWAYAQAGRYASSYSEAYSRELAPRY